MNRSLYEPYLMKIEEIIEETPDVKTFRLVFQDEKLRDNFDFHAGQFGLYSVFGEGESTFCIASSPTRKGYIECSVKKVFETGLSTREVRKKFDKYMEMTVYPLKNFSGKVVSVVEIRRDVTRNIQLDEELKKRMRELEDFYDMAVGRELKMKELKKEIDELKGELRKHKS